MLRTKGEPGTGNIVEAVRHLRQVQAEIKQLVSMSEDEVMVFASDNQAPFDVLMEIRKKVVYQSLTMQLEELQHLLMQH